MKKYISTVTLCLLFISFRAFGYFGVPPKGPARDSAIAQLKKEMSREIDQSGYQQVIATFSTKNNKQMTMASLRKQVPKIFALAANNPTTLVSKFVQLAQLQDSYGGRNDLSFELPLRINDLLLIGPVGHEVDWKSPQISSGSGSISQELSLIGIKSINAAVHGKIENPVFIEVAIVRDETVSEFLIVVHLKKQFKTFQID